MKPRLRFEQDEICVIAKRYSYQSNEDDLIKLRSSVLKRGSLQKDELQRLAYWKSPRSAGRIGLNDDSFVDEITRFAFNATSEKARIEALRLLDGVSWPTASAILHFFHIDPYPIMDFRALWSVSLITPLYYKFDFWWLYVDYCRHIAASTKADMRTLDRALWQYSKENQ